MFLVNIKTKWGTIFKQFIYAHTHTHVILVPIQKYHWSRGFSRLEWFATIIIVTKDTKLSQIMDYYNCMRCYTIQKHQLRQSLHAPKFAHGSWVINSSIINVKYTSLLASYVALQVSLVRLCLSTVLQKWIKEVYRKEQMGKVWERERGEGGIGKGKRAIQISIVRLLVATLHVGMSGFQDDGYTRLTQLQRDYRRWVKISFTHQ